MTSLAAGRAYCPGFQVVNVIVIVGHPRYSDVGPKTWMYGRAQGERHTCEVSAMGVLRAIEPVSVSAPAYLFSSL